MPHEHDALVRFFEEQIPFNAHLGVKVLEVDGGRCVLRIPFKPFMVGDPSRPALHGGVLSALGDAAGGLAVFSTLDGFESRVSTVDLRVDYLRPGKLEPVISETRLIRAGNRVAVTHTALRHESDYVIAECRGVYNIRGPKKG